MLRVYYIQRTSSLPLLGVCKLSLRLQIGNIRLRRSIKNSYSFDITFLTEIVDCIVICCILYHTYGITTDTKST